MRYQSTIVIEKEVDDGVIEIIFEGACYYNPGRFSGPPENCYPDDSDIEIDFVRSDPPGYTPTPVDFERASRYLWREAEACGWDDFSVATIKDLSL
jgi:hypothetical protein